MQAIVLQAVLMAFDLVLMAAVIPIIQKVESGKDRILKARCWHDQPFSVPSPYTSFALVFRVIEASLLPPSDLPGRPDGCGAVFEAALSGATRGESRVPPVLLSAFRS